MEARANLRYARISPRKVQIVLDLIRGKDADLAMAILKNTPKAACEPLVKLLGSAMLQSASFAPARFSRESDREHRAELFEY